MKNLDHIPPLFPFWIGFDSSLMDWKRTHCRPESEVPQQVSRIASRATMLALITNWNPRLYLPNPRITTHALHITLDHKLIEIPSLPHYQHMSQHPIHLTSDTYTNGSSVEIRSWYTKSWWAAYLSRNPPIKPGSPYTKHIPTPSISRWIITC